MRANKTVKNLTRACVFISEVCLLSSVSYLTRVEQDDSFEADKLLRFEFEHAETGGSCKQHVEDLGHAFNTVALTPGEQSERKHEEFCLDFRVRFPLFFTTLIPKNGMHRMQTQNANLAI